MNATLTLEWPIASVDLFKGVLDICILYLSADGDISSNSNMRRAIKMLVESPELLRTLLKHGSFEKDKPINKSVQTDPITIMGTPESGPYLPMSGDQATNAADEAYLEPVNCPSYIAPNPTSSK